MDKIKCLGQTTHQYWVYIVASATGTLYVGMTNNIDVRVRQHKEAEIEGFSKTYHCTRLVYYERYDFVQRAIGREKQLKGWKRAKKIALIQKAESTLGGLGRELGSRDALWRSVDKGGRRAGTTKN